jgi:hypothetical protein
MPCLLYDTDYTLFGQRSDEILDLARIIILKRLYLAVQRLLHKSSRSEFL